MSRVHGLPPSLGLLVGQGKEEPHTAASWLHVYAVTTQAEWVTPGGETAPADEGGPLAAVDVDAGKHSTEPFINLDGMDDALANPWAACVAKGSQCAVLPAILVFHGEGKAPPLPKAGSMAGDSPSDPPTVQRSIQCTKADC